MTRGPKPRVVKNERGTWDVLRGTEVLMHNIASRVEARAWADWYATR